MKGCGWALIVFGGLAVLGMFAGLAMGREPNGGAGIIFVVVGLYLLHRAKQKEKEKEEHDEWSNNE